jgi:hypothetical protein
MQEKSSNQKPEATSQQEECRAKGRTIRGKLTSIRLEEAKRRSHMQGQKIHLQPKPAKQARTKHHSNRQIKLQ